MESTLAPTEQGWFVLLEEAVRRATVVSITHRRADGWRLYKSSFQPRCVPGKYLLLEPAAPRAGRELEPLAAGTEIGVTFRIGHKKCLFSSAILANQDAAEAFTVAWPSEIQQMQRRAFERAVPPPGEVIAVRFWPTAPSGAPTDAKRTVYYGELEDVSAGGIRINAAAVDILHEGQSFECLFAPRRGTPPILCEATLRHRESADRGRASLGLQFIGLETTPDGRATLERLASVVSDFQRRGRRPAPSA
jgi:c-di-GMP-binding flagellar brake protein YcgR